MAFKNNGAALLLLILSVKDLINKPPPLDVWLQGKIDQTIGNDIILADSTGKVKVVGCDFSDGVIGIYCCVIGVAIKTSDIPEVKPTKFIKVNSPHQSSWEYEVKEAQLFLQGKAVPKITSRV